MIQKHLSRIRIISFFGMSILASSLISNPTEIKDIFAPSHLGKIELTHDQDGFHVSQNGTRHDVKKLWMDPILRDMTSSTLKKFLANGYIRVNQMSDNEFTLKAKGRLLGGGPIAGAIAYWVTKSVGYGATVAVATAATIASGGAAAPAAITATSTAIAGVETASTAAGLIFTCMPFLP